MHESALTTGVVIPELQYAVRVADWSEKPQAGAWNEMVNGRGAFPTISTSRSAGDALPRKGQTESHCTVIVLLEYNHRYRWDT